MRPSSGPSSSPRVDVRGCGRIPSLHTPPHSRACRQAPSHLRPPGPPSPPSPSVPPRPPRPGVEVAGRTAERWRPAGGGEQGEEEEEVGEGGRWRGRGREGTVWRGRRSGWGTLMDGGRRAGLAEGEGREARGQRDGDVWRPASGPHTAGVVEQPAAGTRKHIESQLVSTTHKM